MWKKIAVVWRKESVWQHMGQGQVKGEKHKRMIRNKEAYCNITTQYEETCNA